MLLYIFQQQKVIKMCIRDRGSIILILILVIVNAFFASAEMAIVSINKTKLNLLAEENNKKAKLLLNLQMCIRDSLSDVWH